MEIPPGTVNPARRDAAALTFLATRRSRPPKLLAAPAPDRAALREILTIAARVPDHGKLAPWRFVVIAGEARARLGDKAAAIVAADNPDSDETQIGKARGLLQRAHHQHHS